MDAFQTMFNHYVCSGHALLYVDTSEKDRAINSIASAAEEIGRHILIWSVATGWRDKKGKQVNNPPPSPQIEDHIQWITQSEKSTIHILQDFGEYLKHDTYPNYDLVISWLDQLRKIIASAEQTIVFVGPDLFIPKTLLHDITRIDFELPDTAQITERINFICSYVIDDSGKQIEPDKKLIPQIVDACRGMTAQQVCDRVALALRIHKDLNEGSIQTIVREKAGVIRASGLLNYIEPPDGGLSNIGGYDALKRHVMLDKPCFSQTARDFGIEFPRGLMLVGIPGCGKTLLSIAIASELNLPLISMDVGNIMDKYVGESENKIRDAIKMIDRIAPCVLQLDEIEKGFGGAGNMEGGATRRVFGTFIKWLNDRTSPVYIVATANQVESLPPEFCRKGRFDEIYGLDLPNDDERQEIFKIHLNKRNRNPMEFEIESLANKTNGYTGADIEQIIKLGLKMAFFRKESLFTAHLLEAIKEIIPLSKTEANRITATKTWCEKHAKPANKTNDVNMSTGRKVVIGSE
ncbi:MAG: AAA family ATPase [Candidatus Heimdallarchaeota archaeon]|nr:MAG: AAA family ATPase [Candidatus Heimdallarchaeota archaeon]